MTHPMMLSFTQFDKILKSAENRFHKRITELEKLVSAKSVYLFGYGGKGRMLAWQIKQSWDTNVIVYDSSPKVRDLAEKEGFATVSSPETFRQSEYGVILGACQAQIEQAAIVQHNYIYYQ